MLHRHNEPRILSYELRLNTYFTELGRNIFDHFRITKSYSVINLKAQLPSFHFSFSVHRGREPLHLRLGIQIDLLTVVLAVDNESKDLDEVI